MINLLPPETRDNIMYARRNTILVRWIVALLLGIGGVIIIIAAGHFYIQFTARQMQSQVTRAEETLKAQKLEETQARAESMSNSFKLVTQVLSKQVLFSEVIKQVGAVMPSGASLANLNVNQLEGGIDLQIAAIDYQTATQVQVNLQDPNNKLFSKVDIISISCEGTEQEKTYPCSGRLRALFNNDNNPFLFLSSDTGGAES